MTPSQYVQGLGQVLGAAATPKDAAPMAAYMKHHFEFYGVKSKARTEVVKQYIQEHGLPEGERLKEVCRLCFAADAKRELQYAVNDLLQKAKRQLDPSFLALVEELIPQKSWWDSIDFLYPKIAGMLLLNFPDHFARVASRKHISRYISRDHASCSYDTSIANTGVQYTFFLPSQAIIIIKLEL
jgi:hypothetical protein